MPSSSQRGAASPSRRPNNAIENQQDARAFHGAYGIYDHGKLSVEKPRTYFSGCGRWSFEGSQELLDDWTRNWIQEALKDTDHPLTAAQYDKLLRLMREKELTIGLSYDDRDEFDMFHVHTDGELSSDGKKLTFESSFSCDFQYEWRDVPRAFKFYLAPEGAAWTAFADAIKTQFGWNTDDIEPLDKEYVFGMKIKADQLKIDESCMNRPLSEVVLFLLNRDGESVVKIGDSADVEGGLDLPVGKMMLCQDRDGNVFRAAPQFDPDQPGALAEQISALEKRYDDEYSVRELFWTGDTKDDETDNEENNEDVERFVAFAAEAVGIILGIPITVGRRESHDLSLQLSLYLSDSEDNTYFLPFQFAVGPLNTEALELDIIEEKKAEIAAKMAFIRHGIWQDEDEGWYENWNYKGKPLPSALRPSGPVTTISNKDGVRIDQSERNGTIVHTITVDMGNMFSGMSFEPEEPSSTSGRKSGKSASGDVQKLISQARTERDRLMQEYRSALNSRYAGISDGYYSSFDDPRFQRVLSRVKHIADPKANAIADLSKEIKDAAQSGQL